MFRAGQRREAITYYIFSLWRNWGVSLGVSCLILILSPEVSKSLLPVITFALVVGMFLFIRGNRKSKNPTCFRIPYMVTLVMLATAVLMVLFNLYEHTMEYEWTGQPINHMQPFIAILVMAPLYTAISALYMVKGGMNRYFCRECTAQTGSSMERGFMGKILSQEAVFQTRMLFYLSLFTTVIEWAYYFIYFNNVNINSPDTFFFFRVPVILYILSVIYLGFRYYSMWVYYCHNDELGIIERDSVSSLRYLVVSGDTLYLKKSDRVGDKDYGEYDTPARVRIPYREKVTDYDARHNFKMLSGVSDCFMRFLFENSNLCTLNNSFHYLCYLDDRSEIDDSRISGGEWLPLNVIDRLMREKGLSHDLSAEVMRIYRVAMAWKTYDANGRRLYKIKHYHPTFRLRDIKDWDVDFNDRNWLMVAANNEDRPFFKARRLWQKLIGK